MVRSFVGVESGGSHKTPIFMFRAMKGGHLIYTIVDGLNSLDVVVAVSPNLGNKSVLAQCVVSILMSNSIKSPRKHKQNKKVCDS